LSNPSTSISKAKAGCRPRHNRSRSYCRVDRSH
jgi:hypothetical protein